MLGAALAVAMPAALANAQEKTPSELCAEAMESYGAAPEGDAMIRKSNAGRKSVYSNGTLANGDSVRMRCTVRRGGVVSIQVFAPPVIGGANPGAQWTDANSYLGPPQKKAEVKAPPPEEVANNTPPPEGEAPPADGAEAAPPAEPPEDRPGTFKRAPKP
ncbi:MAG TPA: hypothetical protein VLA52_06670 [Thermohalobaculum sp.]|nr:hypothetical protein [Thermohalobaculum sp.]